MSQTAPAVPPRSEPVPDDAIDLVPGWARRAAARLRTAWTRADTIALVLIVVQCLLLAPLLARGALYIDDWRAQSYAAGQPFWPWIVESNQTHFSPGARTIDWLQTVLFPLEHGVAVAVTLVVRLALGLAAWRLIRMLVGPRPVGLLTLVVVLATAGLLPTTAWYRQSITALPVVIAILMAAVEYIRYVRRPGRATLALVVAWLLVGLCFLEKALVIVPWLVGVGLLLPHVLQLPWRTVARRSIAPVVSVGAVAAAFVLFYLSSESYDEGDVGAVSVGTVLDMVQVNLTRAVAPSTAGGPWAWTERSPFYPTGTPPLWLIVLTCAGILVVLGTGLARRRGPTLSVVAAFLSLYLPSVAVIAVGRLARVGPEIAGLELRLWPEVIVVAIVLLGYLLGSLTVTRPPRRTTLVAVVLLMALVAVNATLSSLRFAEHWWRNPAGDVVAQIRSDLGSEPGSRQLVAAIVPLVVPPWVDPDYHLGSLLAPLSLPVDVTRLTPDTRTPTDPGELRPVTWTTVRSAPDRPDNSCGFLIEPGAGLLRVPLGEPVPYFRDSQVLIDLFVGADTEVGLAVETSDGPLTPTSPAVVDVPSGPHELMFRLPADARPTAVTITSSNLAVGVCMTSVTIAVPEPVDAP